MSTKFYDPAAYVGRYESGNDYTILYGGSHITPDMAFDQYGFPQWAGLNNSHAAGRYQFEPRTWAMYAARLGIKDFSPKSQDAVFAACFGANGFNDWLPYDAKLRAAVAAVGGPSAFSIGVTVLAVHS